MTRGLGLILYGGAGIGKTSFALQLPKPLKCITIPPECGYVDLEDLGRVPEGCENLKCDTVPRILQELKKSVKSDKTVVIDSGSGLQLSIFDHSIKEDYDDNDKEFYAYSKGPRMSCPRYADMVCTEFENLRDAGVNVVFICHEKKSTIKNPRGLDYQSVDLDMEEGIREVFKKWAQAILYMCLDPNMERVTKMVNKKAIEGKMKDDDVRVMFTTKSLVHSAKNKLGLPILVDLGDSEQEAYANFVEALYPNFKEFLSK